MGGNSTLGAGLIPDVSTLLILRKEGGVSSATNSTAEGGRKDPVLHNAKQLRAAALDIDYGLASGLYARLMLNKWKWAEMLLVYVSGCCCVHHLLHAPSSNGDMQTCQVSTTTWFQVLDQLCTVIGVMSVMLSLRVKSVFCIPQEYCLQPQAYSISPSWVCMCLVVFNLLSLYMALQFLGFTLQDLGQFTFKGISGSHSLVAISTKALAGRQFPQHLRKTKGERLVAGKGLLYKVHMQPAGIPGRMCSSDQVQLPEVSNSTEGP
jgi:hypothetical protein